jgi:hypothetical protein
MTTKKDGDNAFIDGVGCLRHRPSAEDRPFLTFKESSGVFSVVIFDHTCAEMMMRCPEHSDATRCVVMEEAIRVN